MYLHVCAHSGKDKTSLMSSLRRSINLQTTTQSASLGWDCIYVVVCFTAHCSSTITTGIFTGTTSDILSELALGSLCTMFRRLKSIAVYIYIYISWQLTFPQLMQLCLHPPLLQALELQATSTLVAALHAFPREVDPPCERPRSRPPVPTWGQQWLSWWCTRRPSWRIPLCLKQSSSSAAGSCTQYRLVVHLVSYPTCFVVVCPVCERGGLRRWKPAGLALPLGGGGGCSPYRTQVRKCSLRPLPSSEALSTGTPCCHIATYPQVIMLNNSHVALDKFIPCPPLYAYLTRIFVNILDHSSNIYRIYSGKISLYQTAR